MSHGTKGRRIAQTESVTNEACGAYLRRTHAKVWTNEPHGTGIAGILLLNSLEMTRFAEGEVPPVRSTMGSIGAY